jgi:hypothetical protein
MTPAELEAGLRQFTGTEQWYRHWTGRILYTDGVKYLADNAEAYWLVDAIASHQLDPKVRGEGFQVWILRTFGDGLGSRRAVLTCYSDYDESGMTAYQNYEKYGLVEQRIEFTDFPLAKMRLWVEGGPEQPVILLPSEH